MPNRDFYTADGREWYEPEELVDASTEARTTAMYHICIKCGLSLAPQMLTAHFERTRQS
jgi:hypothetical protein